MDMTLGYDENLVVFGHLGLIFKVTVEQNRSNLNICNDMTSNFSESNTHFL